MLYNYNDMHIVSAPSCLDTDADSMESIIAGNDAGATACAVEFDMTADGIAVLCGHGGYLLADSSSFSLTDTTFAQARNRFPKIVTVGQVVELAKSFACKLCIRLRNINCCAQVQLALHHADYAENAYFVDFSMQQATALAARFPTLHFMADIPTTPQETAVLFGGAQRGGLFGLRGTPAVLTPALVQDAHAIGLHIACTECHDTQQLQRLIDIGVNFIETLRPDIAFSLCPPPVDAPTA